MRRGLRPSWQEVVRKGFPEQAYEVECENCGRKCPGEAEEQP